MSNGHGGYRKPGNPAPVSGPGAHSRRTDGQPVRALPDAQYGENATFQGLQRAVPLAGQQQASQQAPRDLPVLTAIGAPTAQPDTPVTDGAQYGPGANADILGLPASLVDLQHQDAQSLKRYLPALIEIAQAPDTPQGTKNFVRRLISYL